MTSLTLEQLELFHKNINPNIPFTEFVHDKVVRNNKLYYSIRQAVCRKYSWALINNEAVNIIKQYTNKIVEIGAGTGYWAYILSQAGITVNAYDYKLTKNRYVDDFKWHPVNYGDSRAVELHLDSTLMLVWPPYQTPMAYNSLINYTGSTFIYIGEDRHGCTGDERFHKEVDRNWNLEIAFDIPNWPGIHDCGYIYMRNYNV